MTKAIPRHTTLYFLFGVALLLALIYLAEPLTVLTTLSNFSWPYIFPLLGVSAILVAISALKWQLFLGNFNNLIPLRELIGFYLIGYFVNCFLPSFIGGDAVRSYMTSHKKGHLHTALAATIMERYTGLVAMLVIAWVGALWKTKFIVVLCLLSALLLAALYLMTSKRAAQIFSLLPKQTSILKQIEKIIEALRFAHSNRFLIFKALLLSITFHIFAVINIAIAAYAVGWIDVSIIALLLVVPLVLLTAAIPLTPANLGVQEGAFLIALTTIGATPAQAISISLIIRAKVYILGMLGWLVWYFTPKELIPKETVSQ